MTPKSPEEFEQMRSESRRNILDSALRLFAEQGYETTSVSDIARDADISKGLVYNYFESKQQLMQEVINEGLRMLPEVFGREESQIDKHTLPKVLERFRQSLKEDQLFWKFYAELLLQVLRNERLARRFDPQYDQFISLFVNMMKHQEVSDPEVEGRTLAALIDGIALHHMFDDEYPLDEMFDYLIKTYSQDHE